MYLSALRDRSLGEGDRQFQSRLRGRAACSHVHSHTFLPVQEEDLEGGRRRRRDRRAGGAAGAGPGPCPLALKYNMDASLVGVSYTNMVSLISTRTGQEISRFNDHTEMVTSLVFFDRESSFSSSECDMEDGEGGGGGSLKRKAPWLSLVPSSSGSASWVAGSSAPSAPVPAFPSSVAPRSGGRRESTSEGWSRGSRPNESSRADTNSPSFLSESLSSTSSSSSFSSSSSTSSSSLSSQPPPSYSSTFRRGGHTDGHGSLSYGPGSGSSASAFSSPPPSSYSSASPLTPSMAPSSGSLLNPSSFPRSSSSSSSSSTSSLSSSPLLFASGSVDSTIRLYGPTGSLATLRHDDWVKSMSLSADNHRLLSGGVSASIVCWELETLCPLFCVDGSGSQQRMELNAVNSLDCATTNENLFAAGSRDGRLRVFDHRVLPVPVMDSAIHNAKVNHVQFRTGDVYMLSSGRDSTLRMWDLRKLPQGTVDATVLSPVQEYRGHWCENLHTTCSLFNQERNIVTGSEDHALYVYDVSSGAVVEILEGHPAPVHVVDVSKGDDLSIISSCAGNMEVYEWSPSLARGPFMTAAGLTSISSTVSPHSSTHRTSSAATGEGKGEHRGDGSASVQKNDTASASVRSGCDNGPAGTPHFGARPSPSSSSQSSYWSSPVSEGTAAAAPTTTTTVTTTFTGSERVGASASGFEAVSPSYQARRVHQTEAALHRALGAYSDLIVKILHRTGRPMSSSPTWREFLEAVTGNEQRGELITQLEEVIALLRAIPFFELRRTEYDDDDDDSNSDNASSSEEVDGNDVGHGSHVPPEGGGDGGGESRSDVRERWERREEQAQQQEEQEGPQQSQQQDQEPDHEQQREQQREQSRRRRPRGAAHGVDHGPLADEAYTRELILTLGNVVRAARALMRRSRT